jgi:hypothetical protein
VVQNARAVSIAKVYWARVRRLAFSLVFLSWLSLAEWKIFERLLYADAASTGFVIESVRGVLAGTPVSKSWQHRFVGPLLVSALGGASTEALERLGAITLLVANVLLFVLLRRRAGALLAVVCLGLAHFVLAYKLEYPWDGIDQIVFIAFGAWAAQKKGLPRLAPLLLFGAFNHETILYVPLWYLLSRERKEQLLAAATAAILGGIILATRAAFYVGRPDLPDQVYEEAAPLIENHVHIAHNFRALFVDNWIYGRAHISVGFVATIALLVWLALRTNLRRAALWSLVVLGTIVCFGYVNETRHYLVLVAFWIPYAWSSHHGADGVRMIADPVGRDRRPGDDLERRVDPDLIDPREVG